jgi:hypothetical protein
MVSPGLAKSRYTCLGSGHIYRYLPEIEHAPALAGFARAGAYSISHVNTDQYDQNRGMGRHVRTCLQRAAFRFVWTALYVGALALVACGTSKTDRRAHPAAARVRALAGSLCGAPRNLKSRVSRKSG